MATSTSGASPGVDTSCSSEVYLESADAGQRPGRGADLGGVVGQGREVVADDGRGRGELRAGELHPVAGVPGEADHDALDGLVRLLMRWLLDIGFHDLTPVPQDRAGPF